jgi:hypothetical protein
MIQTFQGMLHKRGIATLKWTFYTPLKRDFPILIDKFRTDHKMHCACVRLARIVKQAVVAAKAWSRQFEGSSMIDENQANSRSNEV